jgi:hypothetical protein
VPAKFKHEVFWTKGDGWSTLVRNVEPEPRSQSLVHTTSGAALLTWQVRNVGYEPHAQTSLYSASLKGLAHTLSKPIDSLRVHGVRAVRARYPNVKSVEQMGAMQIDAVSWVPQSSLNLTKKVHQVVIQPRRR